MRGILLSLINGSTMKVFPKIQTLGYQAYRLGIPKEKNPFQYCSLRNQGPQKAAAWSTGWERARKEGKQHFEDRSLKSK